jgi:hypothetical protein
VKIYIGCGLTHVPSHIFPAYTSFIHSLAARLKDQGHQVRYALVHSDPQLAAKPEGERPRLCYQWDRVMVEEADLLVADATFPSLGLGLEMQIAESHGIPVIISYQEMQQYRAALRDYENPDGSKHKLQTGRGFVSLMALGLPTLVNEVSYVDYDQGVVGLIYAVELLAARGSRARAPR